jgi:hypothetical protein
MLWHTGRTGLIIAASEGANVSSGTSTAVWVAVIGVAGLLAQMVLKDWIDARRVRRRPPAPESPELVSLREEMKALRTDNADLRANNERLRRRR